MEIRGISNNGLVKWLNIYITIIGYENRPSLLIVLDDISESKSAREELKRSEAHLQTLIETIPDLIWLKDPEGIYLSCNRRFENFFGAKREDITGKTDYDFVDKESADFFRRHDQDAMAAGKSCINEEEVTFAIDGHHEILETIKTPMFSEAGSLIGVLGISRDITRRRQAEEALLSREQLLLGQNEALLSLMKNGRLFSGDLKEGIAEITRVCSELIRTERVSVWRYSQNFMTVKCLDLYERSKDLHSEGVTFRGEDFPAYLDSHKRGLVFAISDIKTDPNVRNISHDYWDKNNIRSFLDAPIWLHNKIGGLLSFENVGDKREWSQADERLCTTMATLVSLSFEAYERRQVEQALRESEERFKRAFENIPDVVVIYDRDLRIRYINEASKHLTGRQSSDFIGMREEEIWPPEIYNAYLPTLQKVLDTGRVCSVDIDLEFPGKGMTQLVITCAPLLEENGEVREVVGITHNYTQRKRAENEIRLLSDRLRMATESAGIGVWELNLLNNHFLWDKRMYELYGLDPVNCDGTYEMWRQTIHSEDITDTEKQMEDAIANSREFHTHYRIITPGNDIRHLEMHAMIIRAPNGSVLKMIGVNLDISERINAEAAIYEGKAHLEEAQAVAKLGSWVINPQTQTLIWSKGMFVLYNRNETFGAPALKEYIDLLHPEDRDHFQNLYDRILIDGESFECELRTNPFYGPERIIYTKVRSIYDGSGKIMQLTGIAQDIIDRNIAIENLRQNTAELRQLSYAIEQSSNIVVITDILGNIKYVNPRFLEVTGYAREEVLGQNSRILKSGEMPPSEYKDLWDTIISGGTWKGEFHNKKKNGELYWESASISPVKDENGNIVSFMAIKEDITEAKKDNEERRMLEIEMDQARKLEAVGSLASGIAHEINTPIQFVGDNTHFLADSFCSLISLIDTYNELFNKANLEPELVQKKDQAEEKVDLKYIRKEIPLAVHQTLEGVERVTNIVRAMKNFAHSDQGEKTIASINDMLESTLTVARNELKYVADVITEFDESIPEIECCRDELNQVFLNLFINAAHAIADVIKGGSAEKGTIKVSTNKEGDSVIIKISDTGPGIPKSIHHRIFDQFFTTKDVGKGSGQGLAIAQKIIVEKHKGSLDFETEEGKGTTFIVRLPINVQEAVTAYE
ncbi:MAG: hypothetical protein CVT49_16080 [candidate division Zixibacteria bacterium HGW-Zixibacteria-1]|nr:MAG: hypothetical protein CVT49_16080 [candidate division Zixibacteria bacterium HGW-Zixibacteria-1]